MKDALAVTPYPDLAVFCGRIDLDCRGNLFDDLSDCDLLECRVFPAKTQRSREQLLD